jgi:hypothetical protein
LISTWVHEVHPDAPISYRDSRNYLNVHQNSTHKWFTRLNVQTAPFWLTLRHVKPEEARHLSPGVDITDEKYLGDCRASLPQGVADLVKLRTALIAAYNRETVRVAADEPEPAAE